MSELNSSSYEVLCSIASLKVEHVGEALRRLQKAAESLRREGLDVEIALSVEKDRDGLERWPEWVDESGGIKDFTAWGEESQELFVVRLYDGFDNEWMDITGPVTRAIAEEVWNERTKDGTKNVQYSDIDYYKIFPADTTMVHSEQGRRDLGLDPDSR